MKTFYGGIFINKEKLREEGIYTPIKLEYYKIENTEKFGIEIVKTKYEKENIDIEKVSIDNITDNEINANNILDLLKNNEVTPVSAEYVIDDFLKSFQK